VTEPSRWVRWVRNHRGTWPSGALSITLAAAIVLILSFPRPVEAYIGPGAGIAFVSSFLIVLITLALAVFTLLTWPFRWIIQMVRSGKALRKARTKRVVVVGLDGQDPDLTERYMAEGILPNFRKLMEQGSYRRLRTSLPAESPVAWSSFQTGCNPGRHRVFDFLVPNRKSYLPELCSARIEPPARHLSLGKLRIPLGKPRILFERKSRSFWKILGDHGVFSTILRVPISFPPEKFRGALLSAMSVPDLKGTQGTFTYFSSDPAERGKFTGGVQVPIEVRDGIVESAIGGPENPILKEPLEMTLPFSVRVSGNGEPSVLSVNGSRYPLPLREYTPWIPLDFKAGWGMKVRGMSRFLLKETAPHFKLYMTPVNIAPDKPVLPVSQPFAYAMYLAKTQGNFATLGLAEDTWALNERVLDEDDFLKQVYLIHDERERMFFDALAKTRRGAVVCVFDITDRLQHMFFRYLHPDHPANRDKDVRQHRGAIRDMYRKMDELVGRVLKEVDEDTVLFVMSDHGFKPFRRGVNLNSWLHRNGLLVTRTPPDGEEWFKHVDWDRTQAYAVGLGGIYLNREGREAKGIVRPEEVAALKKRIIEGLEKLTDPADGAAAVAKVHDTAVAYSGPYAGEGPDLVVGFAVGYRASWTSATGAVTAEVFEDNTRSWSGDHCMNPADVPGILFCNRELAAESPGIMDLGPTVLDLFGVPTPEYCDGRSLLPS
jgi:predicted AlkP superfamily phosphohydrolase/phosphomutase